MSDRRPEQQQGSGDLEIPRELGEKLLRGEITVGEFLGLSQRSLYAIASIGHQMLRSGNFEAARDVFQGLVAAAPYDSVFRAHLGSALANLEQYDSALEQYSKAVDYNRANSDALAGRGELLLRARRVPEAIRDLQAAVQHDPEGKRASTARARSVLTMLAKAAEAPVAPAGSAAVSATAAAPGAKPAPAAAKTAPAVSSTPRTKAPPSRGPHDDAFSAAPTAKK